MADNDKPPEMRHSVLYIPPGARQGGQRGEGGEGGEGVDKKRVGKAVKTPRVYLGLAKAGNRTAQFLLGCRLGAGDGCPLDFKKAAKWVERAARQGHREAMYRCGCCYSEGQGVRKSPRKALMWFQKAAQLQHTGAMVFLGYAHCKGEGVEKDVSKGVWWYQKAAEQGNEEAQFKLAQAYMTLYNESDKADRQSSQDPAHKSGNSGLDKTAAKAVEWYEKAIENGNPEAMCELADMYNEGKCVERDPAAAKALYARAAEAFNQLSGQEGGEGEEEKQET